MKAKENFKGTLRHVVVAIDEVTTPRVGDTVVIFATRLKHDGGSFRVASVKGKKGRCEGTVIRPGSRREIRFSEARGDSIGILMNVWDSYPGEQNGMVEWPILAHAHRAGRAIDWDRNGRLLDDARTRRSTLKRAKSTKAKAA